MTLNILPTISEDKKDNDKAISTLEIRYGSHIFKARLSELSKNKTTR